MIWWIYWLVIIINLMRIINSKHFLGGTINWRLVNTSAMGTPVNIVITQTYSWTHSLIECTESMTATNQLIPLNNTYASIGNRTLDCLANCTSSGGYIAPSIRPYCTDISAPVGTTVAQRLDIVSVQTGADFFVGFNDSSWRELAQGSGAPWSITSRIHLNPRSDNGQYNNAPVATMMSPINIVKDQKTVIHVPVGDADGDDLRCRWSISSNGIDECGGACPPNSLPSNTTIFPNCTIIITGTIVDKWYAITLMVEDFIDSSSLIPLSATPVQFLVHVVEAPLCNTPPKIIGLPIEQSCTPLVIGQTYSSVLYADNSCGSNVTIVDIATLSYAGVLKENTTMINETTWFKNFIWTPTSEQLGYQVICAMAFDSQDSQSSQYCFKFFVSDIVRCRCPGETCPTTTSTTTTTTTSSTSTSTTTRTTTTSSSTTSSTTTTNTKIDIKTTNPIDWPLLGSILGVILLTSCLLCCLLPYLWSLFCQDLVDHSGPKKMIEVYSIDHCLDPQCQSMTSKNDQISSIKKESSTISISSLVSTELSMNNELDLDMNKLISKSDKSLSRRCYSSVEQHQSINRQYSATNSVRVIRLRSSSRPRTNKRSMFPIKLRIRRVRVEHLRENSSTEKRSSAETKINIDSSL